MSEWQTFEKLAQGIQAELSPDASVSWNESIRGKSGVPHQCDVVVRQSIGQYQFTCVLECKDHAEKVGLGVVRDFESRIRDLDVSQGVLVASRGFTDDAAQYAKACGILTYTLVDAASAKWRDKAMLPLAIVYVNPVEFDIRFLDPSSLLPIDIDVEFDGADSGDLYLRSSDSGALTTAAELVQLKWDALAVARVPDSEVVEYVQGYELIQNVGGGRPATIKFTYACEQTYYYNWTTLAKGRGFIDHSGGTLLSGSDIESRVDFLEALQTWPNTKDASSVPLRPLLTFWLVRGLKQKNPNMPRALVFGRTL